jgi:hypothetical protein
MPVSGSATWARGFTVAIADGDAIEEIQMTANVISSVVDFLIDLRSIAASTSQFLIP